MSLSNIIEEQQESSSLRERPSLP